MRWLSLFLLALVLSFVVVGTACGDDDDDDRGDDDTGDDDDADDDDDFDPDAFRLTSSAFENQGTIPDIYTCENDDPDDGLSPPLAWVNVPAGTVSFALTVRDPDSEGGDTHHWGLVNIPATVSELVEGVSPLGPLPEGAWETLSYLDEVAYAGPCPPRGDDPHRYRFTLVALSDSIAYPGVDTELADVLPQIETLAIEETTLTGLFGRE